MFSKSIFMQYSFKNVYTLKIGERNINCLIMQFFLVFDYNHELTQNRFFLIL